MTENRHTQRTLPIPLSLSSGTVRINLGNHLRVGVIRLLQSVRNDKKKGLNMCGGFVSSYVAVSDYAKDNIYSSKSMKFLYVFMIYCLYEILYFIALGLCR